MAQHIPPGSCRTPGMLTNTANTQESNARKSRTERRKMLSEWERLCRLYLNPSRVCSECRHQFSRWAWGRDHLEIFSWLQWLRRPTSLLALRSARLPGLRQSGFPGYDQGWEPSGL